MSELRTDWMDNGSLFRQLVLAPIKPVDQTRFGLDGNCLSACIASILNCPLELVDMSAALDANWQRTINVKLRELGFCLATIPWSQSLLSVLSGIHIRHGLTKRCADSSEFVTHAVIYYGEHLVHDPHPDKSGLTSWSWVSVLAPLWSRP